MWFADKVTVDVAEVTYTMDFIIMNETGHTIFLLQAMITAVVCFVVSFPPEW